MSSKSGLCLRTELVKILNIQKIQDFLSLKFPKISGGNLRCHNKIEQDQWDKDL